MPRFKLLIEYDGTPFSGWQSQADAPSVQGALSAAVRAVTGVSAHVQGAGRTDAGVHALGQVAHVDLERDWDPRVLRDALNANLRPHPVAVLAAERVADDFDARFSASRRVYEYRILNRRPDLALDRERAWRVGAPLELERMQEGSKRIIGRHDFTTFRASECQAASPVKTLDVLEVARAGEALIVRAEARSFLHTQVRSMVGSLVKVGDGSWTPDDLAAVLAARDRRLCGPLAPPYGLYLVRVDYEGGAAK